MFSTYDSEDFLASAHSQGFGCESATLLGPATASATTRTPTPSPTATTATTTTSRTGS